MLKDTAFCPFVEQRPHGKEEHFIFGASLEASKHYAQTVAAYTKGTGIFTVCLCGYALYTGSKEAVANKGREMPSVEKYLLQKAGRMI